MQRLRSRLRPGLRARMTASYVLVTFAAVVLVEGLIAALVIPNLNQEQDLSGRVLNTASDYAVRYGGLVNGMATASGTPSHDQVAALLATRPLGDPGGHLRPGDVQRRDYGVVVPQVSGTLPDTAPMSLALLLDPSGQVLASSYPDRYPPGSAAGDRLPIGWQDGITSVNKLAAGRVAWAAVAILEVKPGGPVDPSAYVATGKGDKLGKGSASDRSSAATLGFAYVQVPVPDSLPSWSTFQPLAQSGLVLLLVTLPMGVLFGMLTTRGMVRRLRDLAAGTVGFAAGDFSHRVRELGPDEVGQLERHFNRMAERLDESIAEQRTLAERTARLAERSRISRELHDSISQDLFSIGTLVAGLRRALPAESAVQPELQVLSTTVSSAIQDMRALLLELRPTALDEKGLQPALAELCEAYAVRVGVRVGCRLAPAALGPAAEQALFRIAQEGLSNAVRHSEADEIEVRLRPAGASVELTVADNGRGFADTSGGAGHGMGLKLMAERVRELGGSLAVETRGGGGTLLRVLLPAAAAAP